MCVAHGGSQSFLERSPELLQGGSKGRRLRARGRRGDDGAATMSLMHDGGSGSASPIWRKSNAATKLAGGSMVSAVSEISTSKSIDVVLSHLR